MDGDASNKLKKDNFATNQEYFMYKNTCDACMRCFDAGRLIDRAESVIKNPTTEVLDKIAEMRAWQSCGYGRSW